VIVLPGAVERDAGPRRPEPNLAEETPTGNVACCHGVTLL
jgi:hypothetical protein